MAKYFKSVWLGVYTVLVGMRLTLIHLFKRNVTVQYPDERYPIPDNARNRIYVDMDLCDACNRCARACPVDCITVEGIRAIPGEAKLSNGDKRNQWVANYQIDFAKCCFCGLCIEPCPSNANTMTVEFEYSTENRDDLIYTFSKMTPEEIKEKKEKYEVFQAEKKRKAAEAKAKKEAEEKNNTAEGNN